MGSGADKAIGMRSRYFHGGFKCVIDATTSDLSLCPPELAIDLRENTVHSCTKSKLLTSSREKTEFLWQTLQKVMKKLSFPQRTDRPQSKESKSLPNFRYYSWIYRHEYNKWMWCISEMLKWKIFTVQTSISRSLSCQYSAAWKAFLRLMTTCILFVGCSSSGEIYSPSQTSLSSPVYANAFEIWGHPGQIRHSTSPVTFRIQCETRYGWEVLLVRPVLLCSSKVITMPCLLQVCVAGGCESLGYWDPRRALLLRTDPSRYPIWEVVGALLPHHMPVRHRCRAIARALVLRLMPGDRA
jgi:hypothetical protein